MKLNKFYIYCGFIINYAINKCKQFCKAEVGSDTRGRRAQIFGLCHQMFIPKRKEGSAERRNVT